MIDFSKTKLFYTEHTLRVSTDLKNIKNLRMTLISNGDLNNLKNLKMTLILKTDEKFSVLFEKGNNKEA